MNPVIDYPIIVFAISLVAMALAALLGAALARRGAVHAESHEYFGVVQTASLTLLALVVAFTFSMAVSRYDQRKNYEEEEANAIGTQYVRAALMPEAEMAKLRAGLRNYLDQRIAWYSETDQQRLREVDAQTARLQNELWDAVRATAMAQPTPVMALVVSGLNDVRGTPRPPGGTGSRQPPGC